MNRNDNDMVAEAVMIAAIAHQGQVDKLGDPYILHCMTVMLSPRLRTTEERVVAALHDVLEDTGEDAKTWYVTISKTFPFEIVDALIALTKEKNETLDHYYERVRANPLALTVKKSDVAHNLSRLYLIQDEETYSRLKIKYSKAHKALHGK